MPSSLQPVLLLCHPGNVTSQPETSPLTNPFPFPACLVPSSCFLSEALPFPLGEARNDHLPLQGHGLVP